MTMADRIAVMNGGRIEQLGAPAELYERPQTAFVASFLGVSNLLRGHRRGRGTRAARRRHRGARAREAIAERPHRHGRGRRPPGEDPPRRTARRTRSTGRLLETRLRRRRRRSTSSRRRRGDVSVYVQNSEPGARPSRRRAEISWSPDSTFVVDPTEGAE